MTIDDLKSIPKLPIPMVSDGLNGDVLDAMPDWLQEWARISGGLTIPVEITRWGGWERIVEHTLDFLAENGLKVSWRYHPLNKDRYRVGESFPLKPAFDNEEINYLIDFQNDFGNLTSFAFHAKVPTLAVLFDCERFWFADNDMAGLACLAPYHALVNAYCPDAIVDWWEAEAETPAPRADGTVFWQRKRFIPRAMESTTKPSVTFFHLWNTNLTTETIIRNGKGGTYWIGLGGGYDGPEPQTEKEREEWFKNPRLAPLTVESRNLGHHISMMAVKPRLLGLSGRPMWLTKDGVLHPSLWQELGAFTEGLLGQ